MRSARSPSVGRLALWPRTHDHAARAPLAPLRGRAAPQAWPLPGACHTPHATHVPRHARATPR
eukprot:7115721-Prymnesium_polylepis.1